MAGYGYGTPAPVPIDIAGNLRAKREEANAAALAIISGLKAMNGMERGYATGTLAHLGPHMDPALRSRVGKLLAGSEGQAMRTKADLLEKQAAKLREQADGADEHYADLRSAG